MTLRRRSAVALAGVAAVCGSAAAAADTDPLLGRWQTEQEGGVVQIYRCGGSVCGRIVDGAPLRANPDQRDIRNGDVALRNRRVMHLPVLQNFTGGPDKWVGGPVYDPVTGDGASKGTLAFDGPNRLKVKGCIAVFLCRTQTWTRAR